jgi:hypothetical protein
MGTAIDPFSESESAGDNAQDRFETKFLPSFQVELLFTVCLSGAGIFMPRFMFREIWDSDSDSIDRHLPRPRGPPFPFIYLAIVCPSVRLPSNRLTKAISRYCLPAAPSGPEYPPPSPIYLFLRRAAGMILCPCDFRHRSTMVMAVGRLKGEEDREHDVLYVCIFLLRLLFSISFAWMLVTEQALSTDIILW